MILAYLQREATIDRDRVGDLTLVRMSGRHDVWLVRSAERIVAVKSFALHHDAERGAFERELHCLRALQSRDSERYPRLLWADDAGVVCVETLAINTLWPAMHDGPAESFRIEVAHEAAVALAELHSCDPAPSPESHGSPADDLPVSPAQVMLSLALHDAGLLPLPEPPPLRSEALIHGDVRWVNMVRGSGAVALIDFESSRPGAPEEDLAALVSEDLDSRVRSGAFDSGGADAFARELISAYEHHSGHRVDRRAVASLVHHRLVESAWEAERGREKVSRESLRLCDLAAAIRSRSTPSWAGWASNAAS